MRELYTNGPNSKDFTLNFFYENSAGVQSAQLACPFFTDSNPVEILKRSGCGKVRLLVRLCEATKPEALEKARSFDGVDVRFFTDQTFHAKFYILGAVALVGSANLTNAGLTKNRELSVVIRSEDHRFDDIPALFDELWNSASVLTDDSVKCFRAWRLNNKPLAPQDIPGIELSSPANINVKTHVEDRTRAYLESFRALYVEILIPAYNIVKEVYSERGTRHPSFENYSYEYELDRFLYWVRGFTTDEQLEEHRHRSGADLRQNIREHVSEWFKQEDKFAIDADRLDRIDRLQKLFKDEEMLASAGADDITDMLLGCATFAEMLRFTKGGLENHIKAFKKDNSIERIRATFHHLAFGYGDYAQRVYDTVYLPEYKLSRWGRNCTFELFGWINQDGVPPLGGRIIKAMRYLGSDVPT